MTHYQINEIMHQNDDAQLKYIGDGIACLTFQSKSNSVSPKVIAFIQEILDHDLFSMDGLVIANEGKNFSVGADLVNMLKRIDHQDFGDPTVINNYQSALYQLKHYHKPIVAAPFGFVLGGGAELVLHCHASVAHEKLRMGLVEVGVGLIPGGGGLKETALRIARTPLPEQTAVLIDSFERLIVRTWSLDAHQAKQWGYLKKHDIIIEDQEKLLNDAKALCLGMTKNFRQTSGDSPVTLGGKPAYNRLMNHARSLLQAQTISDYDYVIAHYIAQTLTGGTTEDSYQLKEKDLYLLEVQGLYELRLKKETRDRIAHLLKTGEMLRN